MRHVFKILTLLVALLIDSTLGSYIRIWDVSPSFLLVTVVAMAMSGEMAEAGIYGVFAGALWDLLWGRTFGFYALLYLYIAILARGFLELVYKNTVLLTAGITCVAALFCEILLCIFGFTIWGSGNFFFYLLRVIIPTAVYTGLLQILLCRVITKISRPKQERGTRF